MSEEVAEVDTSTSHLDDIFNAGDTTAVAEPEEQGLSQSQDEEGNVLENESENNAEPQEQNDEVSELRSQLEAVMKDLELQKEQNRHAQSLIDKQGNEIGDLRKLKESTSEMTSDEYLNKFADDPVQAQKELLQAELDRRESVKAEKEQQIAQNRSTVLSIVPDFDSHIEGIKEWYKGKGASEDFVGSLNSQALVSNVDLAVALAEIQSLNKQLSETKSKNDNVINKLNSSNTVVSGKSGQSVNSDSTIQMPSQVTELSDKQLKELLAKAS